MMNSDNTDFVSLKKVKLEGNTNDYYNVHDYSIENKPIMNLVPKVEIKCKNKSFDIVDKWIARVVVGVPTGNNWHNIVAREIALLKVRYPFLSEQQLRGKALTKFGLPSMCGNLVRTGAGKVTKAIAIELSRRNNKTKRVPPAFKVLKSFLPCVKKFNEKPETDMWVQENHRIPTLCNRKTTDRTKIKTIIKPEMMKNHWRSPRTQSLVINPMNKSSSSLPSSHTRINNALDGIGCSVLTPRKEHPPIPPKKDLLSRFNVIDMPVSNENETFVPGRQRIKQEMFSPDRKQCLRIIANDFKENLCFDDDKNRSLNGKRPKKEMRTYSQLSQESRDILAHLQHSTLSQGMLGFEEDDYRNQIGIRATDGSDINFREEDIETTQFEIDDINFSHHEQYYSESCPNRYERKSFIPSYKRESRFSFVSVSDCSPSSFQRHNSSRNIKRQYSESNNSLPTPPKIVKHNDNHHFQDILSNNTSYGCVRRLFPPQTMLIENFDEPIQSETQYTQYSKLSTANISFEATPLSEKLSSHKGNNNDRGISMTRQCSTPFRFESLSISNASSFSSRPRSSSSLKYHSKEIVSPNVDRKSFADFIKSETMCILTPESAGLSSTKKSPRSPPLEVIVEGMSPDLLNRGNITLFPSSRSDSVSNANTPLNVTNLNIQSIIKHQMPKSFKLSDFCSEYDRGWEIVGRRTTKIHTIENVLIYQNTSVSKASIEKGIQNAIRILDRDISSIDE